MPAIQPKVQTNNLYNNKYIVIKEDTRLIEALEIFENTKAEQLAVFTKQGKFKGYLSKESLYNMISFFGTVDDIEGLQTCLSKRATGELLSSIPNNHSN